MTRRLPVELLRQWSTGWVGAGASAGRHMHSFCRRARRVDTYSVQQSRCGGTLNRRSQAKVAAGGDPERFERADVILDEGRDPLVPGLASTVWGA